MNNIDGEVVTTMRLAFISWNDIASHFAVSKSTMDRWKRSVQYVEPTNVVSDAQLDEIMLQYCSENPKNGNRMAVGHIRSLNLKVSRCRVRESMTRVDPQGREARKVNRIERRRYVVGGPLHMWHIDGHHKLTRFGFVTLGCVDGFSRCIIYMKVSLNNKATTALMHFKEGVAKYGMPSRVRADKGGENVLIADMIIEKRGLNRHSFIAGSSKHNTRIERMWYDVRKCIIGPYKDLFEKMEHDGVLNVDSENDKFVLQYMFTHRIQASLDAFVDDWNAHPLSTEHNKTPQQLILLNRDKYPQPPEDYDSDDSSSDESDGEEEGVPVEPVACPLDEDQLHELFVRQPPLSLIDNVNELMNKYILAKEIVATIQN